MHRAVRFSVCCVALAATQACYNYVPVETMPPAGENVSLVVTDQGRVSLAERFGPGIATIDGKLVGIQDSNYIINVYRVSQISGSHALWTGEQSHIDRGLVGTVRTRQLSLWRTAALVGVVAGVAALTASGISGGGVEPAPPSDSTKPPLSTRIPLTVRFSLPF
ncbi:MAG TPA: hypothetical protein VHB25_15795 [Gemmatimonadaceae bacterium]|nr:hypothetical protein [Gemmatimonadaceae bacterium]